MALDTRDKRLSAINIGCPWRGNLPTPDGSISAADRLIVAFLYSGIAAAAPPEPPEPPGFITARTGGGVRMSGRVGGGTRIKATIR
jgi:hypothetical protein